MAELQDVTSDYYASQYTQRNFYGDLMFNFNYDLTDNLNLKFNIGNNIQDVYARNTENGGTNLDIDGWYHINNVLNPDPFRNLSNNTSRSRVIGFFGNFDFNYKDYLFLNLTSRLEQSSVLFFGGIRGANLRDVDYIKEKDLKIGDTVLIESSGCVHPTKVKKSANHRHIALCN